MSTPSIRKRLSAPLAPSIWMPRLRASLVMPGAEVTSAGEVAAFGNPLDDLGLHRRAGHVLLDVDERRLAG